jgi:hypothetical protein
MAKEGLEIWDSETTGLGVAGTSSRTSIRGETFFPGSTGSF